jgi:hypothetical protein
LTKAPTFGITAETGADVEEAADEEQENASTEKKANIPTDPLRMFGILTPPSLRAAQSIAITMIENVVPQLASVDAEMREIEIQIRRARKHHMKAEAQAAKEGRVSNMEMGARDMRLTMT